MSIIGIGNSNAASPVVLASPKQTYHTDGAEKSFLDYMKKSPIERMEEAWLKAHNLTKEDLEKMPPEKRDAILKAMAEDIKQRIKDAQKKAKDLKNITF